MKDCPWCLKPIKDGEDIIRRPEDLAKAKEFDVVPPMAGDVDPSSDLHYPCALDLHSVVKRLEAGND